MSEKNVYNELKKQIILLEQKPGEVLREKEIMEAFAVSRTPVREAMMRLEMDGLVRIIPNVGSFVEEVSFQKLKDVFEIRSHLVKLTGSLAAARISAEEIAEIRERITEMKVATDIERLMELDSEIHTIINTATRNDILIKMLKGLHDQAVRIWKYAGAAKEYWQNLDQEFAEIAEALAEHDEERAASLLERHADNFSEHIRGQLTF
ncbi:MAG: GntR family transcriptional regulator [Desulfopila sp.]